LKEQGATLRKTLFDVIILWHVLWGISAAFGIAVYRDTREGETMKVVFIIGNAAVGKMTVGQELMKTTGLRLFHNHMMIEPVLEIFGTFNGKAINRLREVVFEEFASSDNAGIIVTYMWAFDMQSDWDYIEHVKTVFHQRNSTVEFYHIELVAAQEVRIQRNITENRLLHKASKRNIEDSCQRLLRDDIRHRCESTVGEIPFENYLKIDNSAVDAAEVARQIQEYFKL
jgi:hypothetical protein